MAHQQSADSRADCHRRSARKSHHPFPNNTMDFLTRSTSSHSLPDLIPARMPPPPSHRKIYSHHAEIMWWNPLYVAVTLFAMHSYRRLIHEIVCHGTIDDDLAKSPCKISTPRRAHPFLQVISAVLYPLKANNSDTFKGHLHRNVNFSGSLRRSDVYRISRVMW